jgi:hypothetical protein
MSAVITGAQHIKVHRLAGEPPWHCHYCGILLACPCTTGEDPTLFWRAPQGHYATFGHIDPYERTGPVVACRDCNCSKGARRWPDWWVPNAITLVHRAEVPVGRNDDLITRGVISVLADMPSRLPLLELADLAGDHADRIRPVLHDLVSQKRLTMHRATTGNFQYRYLFQGVTT